MNTNERIKMLKAMEFIARNVNNESFLNGWLALGVADGASNTATSPSAQMMPTSWGTTWRMGLSPI